MRHSHYDATWWFISNINYIYGIMLLSAFTYYLWRKSKYKYRIAIFKEPDGKTSYRAEYRRSLFSRWCHEHMGITSYEVESKIAAQDVIEAWKSYEKKKRPMKWNKGTNTSYDYYK